MWVCDDILGTCQPSFLLQVTRIFVGERGWECSLTLASLGTAGSAQGLPAVVLLSRRWCPLPFWFSVSHLLGYCNHSVPADSPNTVSHTLRSPWGQQACAVKSTASSSSGRPQPMSKGAGGHDSTSPDQPLGAIGSILYHQAPTALSGTLDNVPSCRLSFIPHSAQSSPLFHGMN